MVVPGDALAAGEATLMPISAVRERLGRALDLHTGAGDADDQRQRTLRRTIRWSYDLLAAKEQALLCSLAPFPGGVDLDAIERLALEVVPGVDPLPVLHRLVDASLVSVDRSMIRYRLLFTVRAFLLDELATRGELGAAESRFLTWATEAADEIGTGLFSPNEAEADRRLRAELANLRAAWDSALLRGDVDTCIAITAALDEAAIWRDLRELWAWCLELADNPLIVGHPLEIRVVGGAAEAARLTGDFDRCTALAQRGLALPVDEENTEQLRSSCWSALGAVAHFGGDFTQASTLWARAGRGGVRAAAGFLSAAALSAAYGGQHELATALLVEAREENALTRCGSHEAFCDYVDGEMVAVEDPSSAVGSYLGAIEEARRVGANFIEGVASVALASARARTGDHATAADQFDRLLEYWSRTGHQPQLWTTARNAVPLLIDRGRLDEVALLLLRADQLPSAAAVDAQIARHSGRAFTSVEDVVAADRLDEFRALALTLTSADIIERARNALADIAAGVA